MTSISSTVVIGAGISGLCAAYTLAKAGKPVTLLEASDRVGGVIQTVEQEGYLWEAGPNTLSSTAHTLLDLCEELGLPLLQSNPAAKKRYIYKSGMLHPAPSDPFSFIRSPLLSVEGKFRLLREGWVRPKRTPVQKGLQQSTLEAEDETIADWAKRRLGKEVLDTLLGPFLSGIYAGDPAQLSMAATLPALARLESRHGSLTAGALASVFSQKTGPKKKKRYRGLQILSLSGGLQALPLALEKAILMQGGKICLSTPVVQVQENAPRQGEAAVHLRYRLILATGEVIEADRVLIATDTLSAAHLLQTLAPLSSEALQAIPYAPMVGVHLGIPKAQISHPLDGFGCLLPRTENLTLLGSIWASSLFPDRAPQDHALFSCFIGGALHPEVVDWSDERCAETVLHDLQKVLGNSTPLMAGYSHIVRWPRAIPQYTVGHLERLLRIQRGLEGHSNIMLLGNYLNGVSLNHCAQQGIIQFPS